MKDRNWWHFRSKNKGKHPHLIINESTPNENYGTFTCFKLTHSEKHGKHKNYNFKHNPDGSDRKSFMFKDLHKLDKSDFIEILTNFKLSDKDYIEIKKIIDSKNKKHR